MLRIAWLSPIGDDPSCTSAFFTRQVLPLIPSHVDVELFVSDPDLRANPSHCFAGRPLFHSVRLGEQDQERPFDAFIFHLEDHPAADFSRFSIGCLPGIVYVHDSVFRACPWGETPRDEASTAADDHSQHVRYYFSAEPFAPTRNVRKENPDADSHTTNDTSGGKRKFTLDTRGLLAGEEFRGIVVATNEHTLEELSPLRSTLAVELTSPPAPIIRAEERKRRCDSTRRRLGIPPSTPVVLFTGRSGVEDRIALTLEAFARLRAMTPLVSDAVLLWTLLTPQDEPRVVDILDRTLPALQLPPSAIVSRRIDSLEELTDAVCAANCLALPRFTTCRGIPPILALAMGAGLPVITSCFGAPAHLPDTAVWKIEPGRGECAELTLALATILTNPSVSTTLGLQAQEFASVVLSPYGVVSDLFEILRSHGPRLHAHLEEARRTLRDEHNAHLKTVETLWSRGSFPLGPTPHGPTLDINERILARAILEFGW